MDSTLGVLKIEKKIMEKMLFFSFIAMAQNVV